MKLSKASFSIYTAALCVSMAMFCFYFAVTGEAGTSATPRATFTTIATGLHNPRGLNFAPDGSLYVAEAGAPGTASTLCGMMGNGQIKCYAETGSIALIDTETGLVTRVVTGLPSLISADGTANGATGVHDVSFQGKGNGYFTIGLGGDPNLRDDYFGDFGSLYGRIGRFNPSGNYKLKEDLAAFEGANNPDGVVPDSNPYGLLALPGRVIVADAGGNDLLEVKANGKISVLAVFPRASRPSPPGPSSVQAVPTSVTLGPDGYLYVGQLTGGPFTKGIASVWRVPPHGGTPEVVYQGFTNIIDLTFGPDGELYVLELAKDTLSALGAGGRIVRIDPDGTQTVVFSGQPLFAPGGIAVDNDGTIYVTVGSVLENGGSVARIDQ